MQYTIRPIPLASMKYEMSDLTYRMNVGQRMTVPVYMWCIEGGKRPIIVDAGVTAEALQTRGVPSYKHISTVHQPYGSSCRY